MTIILVPIIMINTFSFLIMGVDKYKAIRNKYRIPEKYLFLLAILFGSLGIYWAMMLLRHKINKNMFRFGVPIVLIFQLVLFLIIFKYKSML